MKLILTGSTGFIGQEVLHQCLKASSITSLIALSRRDLPESATSNPKLKVIILNDFTSYSDSVLRELVGAESCIWSLGVVKSPNAESAREVNLDYTIAAANAFATTLAPQLGKGKKFRFVYLSGMFTANESIWPYSTHTLGGEVENRLIEFDKQHQDSFGTFIVRPGGVLSKENGIVSMVMGLSKSRSIRVDDLAAVMVNTALNGSKTQFVENNALRTQGRALLEGPD